MPDNKIAFTHSCLLPKDNGEPCTFVVNAYQAEFNTEGQPGNGDTTGLFQTLFKHLKTKHPTTFAMLKPSSEQLYGYLAVSAYRTEDPNMTEKRSEFESLLRRLLIPQPVMDAQLDMALAELGLTMQDPMRKKVKQVLQQIRDYYEGKIKIPTPQNSQTV